MTCVYKLTNQNLQTYQGFKWVLGKKYITSGEGELCGPGWLHAYTSPRLAVLLNPIHANFEKPRLWKANGFGQSKADKGLKIGFTELVLVEEMPLPVYTTAQKVAFAIYLAQQVYKEKAFKKWADNWLKGTDRSRAAAQAAGAAAQAAQAAWEAEWVAEAAAARAAAWAAAARAAAWAAAWAAESAERAAKAEQALNLDYYAKKALNFGVNHV